MKYWCKSIIKSTLIGIKACMVREGFWNQTSIYAVLKDTCMGRIGLFVAHTLCVLQFNSARM